MKQKSVFLHKNRKKRLEQGHPWVFVNEVHRIDDEINLTELTNIIPGELVSVYNHQGAFLAVGYINPKSQILVRIVSYQPIEVMDKQFFITRFQRCLDHRERFVQDEQSYRAVYGEADFVPGVVVDKFNNILVVQFLSLGMDLRKQEIVEALIEVFKPQGIYERSDVGVRELEGLEQTTGVLYGDCPRYVLMNENELHIEVDIEQGQKTGYFFDQRENRAAMKDLMVGWGKKSGVVLVKVDGEEEGIPVNANGKRVTFPYWDGANVLECFAHTGSFTLNACKYGAKRVTCLDISEHALASARRNVALNHFEDRVEFVAADAFEYLREQVRANAERLQRGHKKVDTSKPLQSTGRTWDVIILDPPAFAKTKTAIKGACRGYKDINLHAMKLINEGGYLVTASCSYHIRPDLFLETIQEAAIDAGKIVRLIEYRGAGKDHPQILGTQEGDYLKFAIFEVRGRQ